MKTIGRILAVLTSSVIVAVIAASPASAHDTDHTFPVPNGWRVEIACPHPNLNTGFGSLSYCTEMIYGAGRAAVGLYSNVTHEFNVEHVVEVHDISPAPRLNAFTATASDGTVGTFRGGQTLSTPYGRASFGIQYTYYGFQPIGRWGNFNFETQRFHPGSDWYYATHNI